MLLHYQSKMSAYEVWLYQLTYIVHKYVVRKFCAVAGSTESTILLLPGFFFQKEIFNWTNKRECTKTRFCFCSILRYNLPLSINVCLMDSMLYSESLFLKINSIPTQAD